eukprot:TRINITY_DN24762_c0_g1_i1.p1 TRINITY_DN24762_c0_g1~~TRINITY_DN24762_c0_g1_i1.p1  ORF type:complete len:355 (+),score=48.86 TRINITY_DN24762_c0_g1_i1:90-1067(+)
MPDLGEQHWLGTFWCDGAAKGVSLMGNTMDICDISGGGCLVVDLGEVVDVKRMVGEGVVWLQWKDGSVLSLRGSEEAVYRLEVALVLAVKELGKEEAPTPLKAPVDPVEVIIPQMRPFLPYRNPSQAKYLVPYRSPPRSVLAREQHLPADTDFWDNFKISMGDCTHGFDPPHFLVTASHTDGVLKVNREFFHTYTEGWKAAHNHVVSLVTHEGTEITFRSTQDFWDFACSNLYSQQPGDNDMVVTSSASPVTLTTTPTAWNQMVSQWESLRSAPAVPPPRSGVRTPPPHGTPTDKKRFWGYFIDEWEKGGRAVLPYVAQTPGGYY